MRVHSIAGHEIWKSLEGSYASYQFSVTEHGFKVFCDTTPGNHRDLTSYPRFPLKTEDENFEMPAEITGEEESLLESLIIDADLVNEIHRRTQSTILLSSQIPE